MCGASALIAVATSAAAHTALVASDPADGDVVAELASVRLEFTEPLLDIGNSIVVLDSEGVAHTLEIARPEPQVLEGVVPELPTGELVVDWRAVPVDGHALTGTLAVTLAPPIGPSATASPRPTPLASPSPSASTSPTPSASADAESTPGELEPWMWAVLGLVVATSAAAAVVLVARKNPPPEPRG